MPTFVSLVNLTDQGIQNIKESPQRFEAFEAMAEKMGISRSQLYQRAIHLFLTQQGQAVITTRLNNIYGKSNEYGAELGKLDPAVDFMQGASLVMDEDQEKW